MVSPCLRTACHKEPTEALGHWSKKTAPPRPAVPGLQGLPLGVAAIARLTAVAAQDGRQRQRLPRQEQSAGRIRPRSEAGSKRAPCFQARLKCSLQSYLPHV
jgi:hypothetical protein